MALNFQNDEIVNFNSTLKQVSNKKSNSEVFSYISFAKIVSSYGVIVLHINGFWKNNNNNIKLFLILNFYECFFYYSVPIFVLCIGATLLNFNEKYSLIEYNKKRFMKVFVPLLGWNIILYIYKVYCLKDLQKENLSFSNMWNYFFLSKVSQIFKSLHIFLLTYMLIPLIAFVEKSYKMKICIYYFFLLLITQSLIPYLINLFHVKIVWIYSLNIGYLIYIFSGYIIHNYNFSKYQKYIIYILGLLSFFIHFFGTLIIFYKKGNNYRLHKGYLNVPSILYSCSLFLLIKDNSLLFSGKHFSKFVNRLGSLTFGPFFLHNPLNDTIRLKSGFYKSISFNTLFHSLFVFLLCLIISLILKHIPILKYLVP